MDLAAELQRIYDSEINLEIGWFWDGGIDVRLGDRMNGFLAEETVGSVEEIVPWLQEAIAQFFPGSTYAQSLDAEIRERAAGRIFTPPRLAGQVRVADKQLVLIRQPREWVFLDDAPFQDVYDILQFSLPSSPVGWAAIPAADKMQPIG